ncbi:MAG TPA: Xaa-Pro peptidase family protein [Candidatus Dormibacteraeota bacterium]|nr:Xaa-Pro peptidase family protein [Candidatus Dormibacteraeota bacterium]
MSGHVVRTRLKFLVCMGAAILALLGTAASSQAQQRREREPNSVYAARRANLAAQVDAPIVLWGLTGREEFSMSYIFAQEDNFYYLTGHNEEGAGLVILPALKTGAPADGREGSREILFLPPKDPKKEKWNGVRLAPTDPGIVSVTGFPSVLPFPEMRANVERLAKIYPNLYTILPYEQELGGYPHEKEVVDWLKLAAPQENLKDIRKTIGAMRMIKSAGEIAFLQRAIDLTLDSHLEAMRMMRPGAYEYQIAAKMVEVHAMGGSESEGYAPIVGAGPNSTALHYDKLSRKMENGDIVVLDVGAQYSGYSADITRTLPANGKFTPRQREIYEIVLGAQNAAIAALKPGADFCKEGSNSLYRLAYDYINTHGKDLHGKPLGQYFIHGLGHNIGLNVHDPGEYCKPFQPGMVLTIEPGIYIPEENLGVRIEDDFLITETGNKFLSEKLPRNVDEIEKIMAAGAAHHAQETVEECAACPVITNVFPVSFPGQSQAVSPHGRYAIVGVDNGTEPFHTVFLEDRFLKTRRKLFHFDRHIVVLWKSDSKLFAVTDYVGSDNSRCTIVSVDEKVPPIQVLDVLSRQLSESTWDQLQSRLRNHHAYVGASVWDGPMSLQVKISGHGDADPMGFAESYEVLLPR